MVEPRSTKAALSAAQSRREKDSPPCSVNLSMSAAVKGHVSWGHWALLPRGLRSGLRGT